MSSGSGSLSSGLKFGTGLIIAIAVFAGLGLIVLCGFCWLMSYGLEQSRKTVAVSLPLTRAIVTFATDAGPSTTGQPEQNAEFLAIVRNQDAQGWTDVQYEEYKKSLKGTRIENWTGTVVEAKEELFGGGYYIEVDMSGTVDHIDVYIYTTKEVALAVSTGQQITFSGTIRGLWPEIFEDNDTIQVEDATIN